MSAYGDFRKFARVLGANSGAPSNFWGVNGHITWTWTPNALGYLKANWAFACLRMLELGCRIYRNGYGFSEDASGNVTASDGNTFVDFITNFAQPCGIKVAPVLLMTYYHASITNEATAYAFGFSHGAEAATKLKGLVPYYEMSNELETWSITGRGNWRGDYDIPKFRISRGLLRGTVAGIRSVDLVTPIMGGNGTWMHTAFYKNLLIGMEPDGTTGYPLLDWDLTGWHWYDSNYPGNDDIENATAQGNYNTIAEVASWGKPIYINECGANWDNYSNTESLVQAAFAARLAKFWNIRKTYNIVHVAPYQLFDAASAGTGGTTREMNYGMLSSDGLTKKARYTDFKNFISLHQAQ